MRENLEKAVAELACEDFPEEAMFKLEQNVKMQELSITQKTMKVCLNWMKLFIRRF